MIFFILFATIMGIQVSQTSIEVDRSYPGADRAADMRAMNARKK